MKTSFVTRAVPRAGAILALTSCVFLSAGAASNAATARSHNPAGITDAGFPLVGTKLTGTSHAYVRVLVALSKAGKPVYDLVGPGPIAAPLTNGHGDRTLPFSRSRRGWTHIVLTCSGGGRLSVMQGKGVLLDGPCSGHGVSEASYPADRFSSSPLTVKVSPGAVWTVAAITDNSRLS